MHYCRYNAHLEWKLVYLAGYVYIVDYVNYSDFRKLHEHAEHSSYTIISCPRLKIPFRKKIVLY